MHQWDFKRVKQIRKPVPVIRVSFNGHTRKYKSLSMAAKLNDTYPRKIKIHIDKQEHLNGYLFDYQ